MRSTRRRGRREKAAAIPEVVNHRGAEEVQATSVDSAALVLLVEQDGVRAGAQLARLVGARHPRLTLGRIAARALARSAAVHRRRIRTRARPASSPSSTSRTKMHGVLSACARPEALVALAGGVAGADRPLRPRRPLAVDGASKERRVHACGQDRCAMLTGAGWQRAQAGHVRDAGAEAGLAGARARLGGEAARGAALRPRRPGRPVGRRGAQHAGRVVVGAAHCMSDKSATQRARGALCGARRNKKRY